jgi:hypothetical protein
MPIMLALAIVGCRLPSQEGLKNRNWGEAAPAKEDIGAPGDGQQLIKPMIPPERQIDGASQQEKDQPPRPVRVVVKPQAESRPQKNSWEDERIKSAALETARAIPSVKKMKICLDIEHGEWWAILYEENGPMVELKQFVWNRAENRFDPHLVLERIPRTQLERHLAASEPGRACEAVVVTPKP